MRALGVDELADFLHQAALRYGRPSAENAD